MWRRSRPAGGRAAARPSYVPVTWRRVHQGFFLLLFLIALAAMSDAGVRHVPVRLFFHGDPLAGAATLASAWLIPSGMLLALAVVALTVLFGRAFCGWVCPMGTLHHLVSWLTRRARRGPPAVTNRWRPHFRIKYLLLLALLAAALAGSMQAGLLDPLSLLARSLMSGISPAVHAALGDWGWRPRVYAAAWLTGGILIGLLAADRWIARWWCRALCPLGAGLGWISRASIFRIHVDPERCSACGLCVLHCQGADEPFSAHRVSECHVCLNCVASCPEGAVSYRPFAPAAAPSGGVTLGRRQVITALAAGAVAVPLFRASAGNGWSAGALAVRPPGALPEPDFLGRCIRCGACVNACPTSGLQPAMGEAGIEGLWTPILVPRRGWCEPSCTLCGQVCPTGAIRTLGPEEKGWTRDGRTVRIGTAFLDLGRCLPWGLATPCIVCQEVCPTSPKAIRLEQATARRADGSTIALQRPVVDAARCVGCGLCEAKCPISDLAAIRVTRAGESRDPLSSFTLRGQA